jgi:hypothetical protein
MESLLAFASPDSLKSIIVVMLALFAKDFVVGVLRAFSKRIRGDKDPKNDGLADVADAAADSLEKVKAIPLKK